MKRIQLVDEAPVWYKLWSNQAALLAAVTLLQGLLPFWEGVVPSEWFQLAGAALASAAFVLRNIKQPGIKRGHGNAQ
ncbi:MULTISPECIES: hypothetical protein [unclassified Halomonas]|uniref:DUF7940 domain-containing protein n=1 Tax=unclassified Halomonas TaxID=2609666 RepID=UPI00207693CF|nr:MULTISPECIES: hypothetical protein [unclassified Halomonas]